MSLAPGTRLGPYEILAPIGAGGMGEVYRARDTKLKRDVALKVLPEAFAGDPERMARFQREAEVLASLNHPNIAHIHGLEERALVMELVDGEALPCPVRLETALNYARQIAEALEYAHERGVVHRDLKPANIKITPEGAVKVLDFGLAKALDEGPQSEARATDSPTLTLGATRGGMIMGTAAYMSPEQALGRPVDRRSDIFSFGTVLYEMLTGERAFTGATTPDVLEAVIKNDPDWSKVPPGWIDKLIRRCLTKDRKQRLQAIGEARIALENPESSREGADAPVTASSRPRLGWLWPSVAAMLAISTCIALWAPWRAEKSADRPLVRLNVDLGADVALPAPTSGGSSVVISPDGTRLAYASGTPTKLFISRLDQPKAIEFRGTEGATRPFFSPDGQWVGFLAGNRLNKISVDGGAVVPLGDFPNFAGASWGEDGSILVSGAFKQGLVRIPSGGGPPDAIAGLGDGEIAFALPQILPGDKAILFAAATTFDPDKYSIEVLTLADRHRKIVARGGATPRYLATAAGTGHLVYINRQTLFAVPFDLDKLETRGTAVPILDDVDYERQTGTGQFNFSRTGTLVYRRGSGALAMTTVQWVDATGKKETLRAKPGLYLSVSFSPDGKRIAMTVAEFRNGDIWVYDQERDTMTRLTFGGANYGSPVWSPDGQYIVFWSLANGIFQARADGAGQPVALTQSKILQVPRSFTPDGKRLAYYDATGNFQLWTVPLEDQGGQLKAGKPEQFLKSSFSDQFPSFSPDGRWLAYQSNESGRDEVYVRAFPPPPSGQGRRWQISNGGGTTPHWSRNGHELIYGSGDQIMAASYTVKGDTFVPEKPRVWIAKLGGSSVGTQWDLDPDGKRVAVLTPVDSPETPKHDHEVVFLENFFDELRRRVPVGK